MRIQWLRAVLICAAVLSILPAAGGQPPEPVPDAAADNDGFQRQGRTPLTPLPDVVRRLTEKAKALNPGRTVLLDPEKKRLYLHTEVACRDCVLEMLCVPIGQREHETILNVRARAAIVHAGLLALNLKPGRPVRFYPDYHPPEGPVLQLHVHWVDSEGRQHREDVRSWIRHCVFRYFSRPLEAAPPGIKLPHEELRYDPYNKEIIWYGPMTEKQRKHLLTLWDNKKYQAAIQVFFERGQSRPMQADFVFTGSQWIVNETTGQRHYAAEEGYLITVANFPAATIDVAEKSSSSDGGQTYEAWREKIPPQGTPVLLEIGAAADPSDVEDAESQDERTPKRPQASPQPEGAP